MINQFPENQTDFTWERSYSNAVKTRYNENIKIFSDSKTRGIRMRDFHKFVRAGKAKFKCFPGATSNQLLHYLNVNLQDKNTESVILHVGVNDVLQDSTETNINSFFTNIKEMAKKCRSYNVKTFLYLFKY